MYSPFYRAWMCARIYDTKVAVPQNGRLLNMDVPHRATSMLSRGGPMRYTKKCACGAIYNPESTSICPVCLGSGKANHSEERRKLRKRGKAVRGRALGAVIAALLTHYEPVTVVEKMRGKVGKSTVYNIAREEKAKKEALHKLCLVFGIDSKTGQFRNEIDVNKEQAALELLALKQAFGKLPQVAYFNGQLVFPWTEEYWNIVQDTANNVGKATTRLGNILVI